MSVEKVAKFNRDIRQADPLVTFPTPTKIDQGNINSPGNLAINDGLEGLSDSEKKHFAKSLTTVPPALINDFINSIKFAS